MIENKFSMWGEFVQKTSHLYNDIASVGLQIYLLYLNIVNINYITEMYVNSVDIKYMTEMYLNTEQ